MRQKTRVYWRCENENRVCGQRNFETTEDAEEFVIENNKRNGGYIYFVEDDE